MLIKDIINNTEYTAPSITTASMYTYNTEGRSVSGHTPKSLDIGNVIKGWILCKVTN